MYSVSAVNETKLSELAENLSASFQPEATIESTVADASPADVFARLSTELPGVVKADMQEGGDSLMLNLPGEVLFASGRANLTETGMRHLREILPLLEHVSGEIQVEGHTDSVAVNSARFPSNWELSARRAAATVRFLESVGIDKSKLKAVGLSDSDPIASNGTLSERAQNRRVVIRLSELDWVALNNVEISGPDQITEEPARDADEFSLDEIDPALLEQVLRQIEAEGGD